MNAHTVITHAPAQGARLRPALVMERGDGTTTPVLVNLHKSFGRGERCDWCDADGRPNALLTYREDGADYALRMRMCIAHALTYGRFVPRPVSLAKRGVLAEPGRRVRVPEFILEARRGMGDGIERVTGRVTGRRLDRNEPVGLARVFRQLARNARPVRTAPPADGGLCADVARGCAHVARMDENGHQVGCG